MGQTQTVISIGVVERDTGLSKDTLRVWERRYGFPQPRRDAFGERTYSRDQVDKLRALRRLIDVGHRPGKIVQLSLEQLRFLASEQADEVALSAALAPVPARELTRFLDLIKANRIADVRAELAQAQLRMGLERFVIDLAAPLTRLVGDAWAAGRFEIFEEHIYTEAMQTTLRTAIGSIAYSGCGPTALLTTFPGESHGLGLLMAEAMLALDDCLCISLGTQTPVWDIVSACNAQQADIVALSCSSSSAAGLVSDGLHVLRTKLPAAIEVWAGGSAAVLRRKPPAGIVVLTDLADIRPRIAAWRAIRSQRN
jgi:MerR family transcriptional regulator, light-induced transcriptional regulator